MAGYVPNPRFEADLADDPAIVALLEATAARAADAARQIASDFERTGHYRDSIDVDGNRLLTTDPAGSLIEFGSVNNVPYAPLRKAAEQVGARIVDDR